MTFIRLAKYAAVVSGLVLIGAGCPTKPAAPEPPKAPVQGGAMLEGGGAAKPPNYKPLTIDDITLDTGILSSITLAGDDCSTLPDLQKQLDDAFNRYVDQLAAELGSVMFSSGNELDDAFKRHVDQVASEVDVMGGVRFPTFAEPETTLCDDYYEKRGGPGPCKEEWDEVQEAYGDVWIDAAGGKSDAGHNSRYDKAKAAWSACIERVHDIRTSCVSDNTKKVDQAKAAYATGVKEAEAAHAMNATNLDKVEAKCLSLAKAAGQSGAAAAVPAAPEGGFVNGGKKYYPVRSTDPNGNSGDKVCQKMGLTCVGYTAKTTDICTHYHPGAEVKSGVDGSNAGFYCNGAPQGGICAKDSNTCRICPRCNVNADCDDNVGDLYREMYVECK